LTLPSTKPHVTTVGREGDGRPPEQKCHFDRSIKLCPPLRSKKKMERPRDPAAAAVSAVSKGVAEPSVRPLGRLRLRRRAGGHRKETTRGSDARMGAGGDPKRGGRHRQERRKRSARMMGNFTSEGTFGERHTSAPRRAVERAEKPGLVQYYTRNGASTDLWRQRWTALRSWRGVTWAVVRSGAGWTPFLPDSSSVSFRGAGEK
jgi:hypothetical protein